MQLVTLTVADVILQRRKVRIPLLKVEFWIVNVPNVVLARRSKPSPPEPVILSAQQFSNKAVPKVAVTLQ